MLWNSPNIIYWLPHYSRYSYYCKVYNLPCKVYGFHTIVLHQPVVESGILLAPKYSFLSTLYIARQTYGTNRDIVDSLTRKLYIKLRYDSPVARNLKVIINLSAYSDYLFIACIASRNFVSFFSIKGFNRSLDILRNCLNCSGSS